MGGFEYNLRFPGQQYDAVVGLHYNYFRDYDPATGRYAQSDPIGLSGGLNTYGYVGGYPVGAIDSLGLQAAPAYPNSPPPASPPRPPGQILQFPRSPASPPAASPNVGMLGRCLGVLGGLITPSSISQCQDKYPPIDADCSQNDCSEILKEIYRYMNEISKRLTDLLTDRCGMYTEAYSGPNASLGAGCNGSWLGHIHQLEGWQAGLRWQIERAVARGCPVPPGAYALATRPLPGAPRGAAPRG
jgi:RHS repeat-associated protein